jgi:stage V sporulation protein G
MKITEVKIFPVQEDKLKAYVTITLNDCFIIRDLKVIQGKSGMFVAMPSKKTRDGSFKDIAHPLNSDTRQQMEDLILEAYEASLKDQKKPEETKTSQLGIDN